MTIKTKSKAAGTSKPKGGKREGAGAKPLNDGEAMKRMNVMLDDATVIKAKLIGDGNLSGGLRDAVRRVRVAKLKG